MTGIQNHWWRAFCLLLFFFILNSLFFIPSANALLAEVPETGQTTSYATGDDGALKPGLPWPTSRFTANGNGTVTDNLTGLIWLQNANCTETVSGITKGGDSISWDNALTWSNGLASGNCTLTDGSSIADWRLPDRLELESLVDSSKYSPALPVGHPFTAVQSGYYWSSSTYAANTSDAGVVYMSYGYVLYLSKTNSFYVWPVRGGQFGNSVISVSPSSGSYGDVAVGGSSSQTITVSNSAAATGRLQINAMALRGTDPSQFSINPVDGSGGSCGTLTPILAPGASCTVAVSFTSTSAGAKAATLRVSGSDVNAPNIDIALTGTGLVYYTATGSVSGGNGSISTTNPVSVLSGANAAFTLAPAATYQPASSVTGTCPTGSWNGNDYTTGAINADCSVGFTFTQITYPLTLTFHGTGGGSVALSSGGNCAGSCSQSIDINNLVTLTPAADGTSVFSGWSGCPSVSGNQCSVTMTAAQMVNAYFNLVSGGSIKANGSTYGTISGALSNLLAGGELALKAGDFYEDLTFNRAISFTLRGGYDSGFTAATGAATIRGAVTITAGTVTVDGITIQ